MPKFGIDFERTRGEIDLRVRIAEIQAGHQFSVFQRQSSLDQSGHTGHSVEVANVGFH